MGTPAAPRDRDGRVLTVHQGRTRPAGGVVSVPLNFLATTQLLVAVMLPVNLVDVLQTIIDSELLSYYF